MKRVVQMFIKMIVNLIHKGDQKLYGKYFDKKGISDFHCNSLIVGIVIVSEQAVKTLEEGVNLFKANDKDKEQHH